MSGQEHGRGAAFASLLSIPLAPKVGETSGALVRSRRRRPARGIAARPRSVGLAGRGGVAGDDRGRQGIGADAPLPIPLRFTPLGALWVGLNLPRLVHNELRCRLALKSVI